MIRRKLPRTVDAGWVVTPYRTKRRRILLSVRPRPATCPIALQSGQRSKAGRARTALAIFSSLEGNFLHRREAPSRPSGSERQRAAASRRGAWTGGADARRSMWREWQASASLRGFPFHGEFAFCADGNRPDEAQQLAAEGGHDLWFMYPLGRQFLVASAQPPLRFAGHRLGFLVQPLLPFFPASRRSRVYVGRPRRLP